MEKMKELNTLENCLEDLRETMEGMFGHTMMQSYMYPLLWYIGSGRATREFEKKFVEKYADKKELGM